MKMLFDSLFCAASTPGDKRTLFFSLSHSLTAYTSFGRKRKIRVEKENDEGEKSRNDTEVHLQTNSFSMVLWLRV